MLIFLVGLIFLLLGVLAGGALCVRYLRREITDEIGPKLGRVQFQLEAIGSELNLAVATRHVDLSARPPAVSLTDVSLTDGCRYARDG